MNDVDHDVVARVTHDAGPWPVLVVKRCSDIYRGRPCRQEIATVTSTPRGPLYRARIGGAKVGEEGSATDQLALDLLEWPLDHMEADSGYGRGAPTMFAVCRRHGGTQVERKALVEAASRAKRTGKVVEL